MSIDLSSVLEQTNQFTSQAAKAANDLFNLSTEQAVASSEDSDLQRSIGLNNQVIESAKLGAEFATQNAKIKGANALGTNIKDQGEVLTSLSTSILDLIKQKDVALQTIKAKQSVGLFDDPLQYIMNQVTLPDDIAKHNAINEDLNARETAVETLNKLSQSTNLTQSQLTESITQAGMEATSKNTAAAATLAANKSSRDALAYNAQGITAALNVSKEILGSEFNVINAQNAQTHIDIALQHLELSRQEFDFRKQEKAISDAARNKETDTDSYVMSKVNDGLTRMGMSPIPLGSPRAGSILALVKTNSPAGKLYAEAFQISQDSELAGGATILAPSPARAVELINTVPGIKLTGPQMAVKELLGNAVQIVATEAAKPGSTINLKDSGSRNAAINFEATNILSKQAAKIIPGDQTNVFNIPSLGTLINASPEMQKLPVVAKVLAPAIAAGVDVSDPDKAFSLVGAALNAKTITYPEAIELTSVYSRGVKVNMEARQLQSLGLNLIPRNSTDPSIYSYNVPITAGDPKSGLNSKAIVDLTKPDQVGRALNKWMAIQNNPFAQGPTWR